MKKAIGKTILLSLVFFHYFAFSQTDKFITPSVSIQADPGGLFANTIAFVINAALDKDNDYYDDDYYEEKESRHVNGKKLIFGGEFKLNFNLNTHVKLSGGYRILSIPNDYYGKQIISSGFYLEPQVNLSNNTSQTPFLFGQFGKSSFSQQQITSHWHYTFGFGYKYEGTSIDLGYNLFNNPIDQESEFYIQDNVFETENSFLNKGYALVRFTADLF